MFTPTAADLAPGDRKSAALELATFEIRRVRSAGDPDFAEAYDHLWGEFGAKHQMEERGAIERRLAASPAMLYEMVLVKKQGRFAAVRDHTAITFAGETVVHLSHNLVAPEFRRTGLAGWMRAFPIATARELAADAAITLVAELEYADAGEMGSIWRLRAYERGGFRKIDPSTVRYHQPDLRSLEEIDRTGGARPLPMQLCARLVGQEDAESISGGRVRQIVEALYTVYGAGLRAADMAHPALSLAEYPPDDATIALLPLSA